MSVGLTVCSEVVDSDGGGRVGMGCGRVLVNGLVVIVACLFRNRKKGRYEKMVLPGPAF